MAGHSMLAVTNISAYKFACLNNLKEWREKLLSLCKSWRLRGTILLSTEGINLFVAGERAGIDALLAELRGLPALSDLSVKVSESSAQPFRRMLVRIKREIIPFGVDGIDPATRPSPKLSPLELKRWLDEGRPVTLLDTRNDYEVKLGTFRDAVSAGITHFRQFPEAVRRLPESLKDHPIVMFCTGGIRCEKAGPYMEREGFTSVYQLEGGILKYFEECGSAHYNGECFVFDQRVGLDPHLEESDATQCFCCQSPLTPDEQASPRYVPGESCPYCYKEPAERAAMLLSECEDTIRRAANPLPGCMAYDNYRPLKVPGFCDGLTVLEFLDAILAHQPAEVWRKICREGRVLDENKQTLCAESRVRAGQRLLHLVPGTMEPVVNGNIALLHVDEAIIVINKPAPLPAHPGGRFNRNTLQYILSRAFYPQKPRPAHRIDANTTGVTVLCRTRHFAAQVQPQFARGEVEKRYLVRVHGHPPEDEFVCDAPITAEPGEGGFRTAGEAGLPARTKCRVLCRHPDGTALIQARPLTGRTNQIRIHLWNAGHPVCGDPTYLVDHAAGQTQPLPATGPPMSLHAWRIAFLHPLTRQCVEFTAPPPPWAERPPVQPPRDTDGSLCRSW